jgi:subtilisin family serine protease
MRNQKSQNAGRFFIALFVTFAVGAGLPMLMPVFGQERRQSRDQDTASARQPQRKFFHYENAIPGRYIVVFKDEAVGGKDDRAKTEATDAQTKHQVMTEMSAQLTERYGGQVRHVFSRALNGFAGQLSDDEAFALSQDSRVAFVQADRPIMTTQSAENIAPTATQPSSPWNLDRIDQRDSRNGTYTYNTSGAGVNVYVVDTGIRRTNREFQGRAFAFFDAANDGQMDCHGHGTHVAGTVGGATYGVAKNARLYSVRVMGCKGGTVADMIRGIDWVAAYHSKPAVANISMAAMDSTGKATADPALDQAVRRLIQAGVTTVVAAANDGRDANLASPARVAEAITVGSVNISDVRAVDSNYGAVVDLFAPGVSITSAGHRSDTDSYEMSGTSMAAPHVAGVAALYLESNRNATPATVAGVIINAATSNRLYSLGDGSPNRLLYSLVISGNSGAPCSNCTALSGSLAGTGYSNWQPNGNWYQTTSYGNHNGWLQVPAGTNFDLYLYKWDPNGNGWVIVASATSYSALEQVSYYGAPGYYIWRIYSWSGGGGYNFWMQRPQ